MIPKVDRELTSGGIADSTSFDLSQDDASHIMTILRDTLYSDKVLAVLREYSANAWDAHRMVGKVDLPIKVTLPTPMEPKLTIRDFGPGLSQEEVFNIFTKYGKSTKRETDNAVGMLGIGSKSGFAYADSFTVTSWHGGTKSLYVAVLDKSDKGTMNLLHREDCAADETGIEIQLAVEARDISEFRNRAQSLFKHFVPRPEINIDLPTLPSEVYDLKSGFLYVNSDIDYDDKGWTAVMGCVPYKIDLNRVRDVKPGIGDNAYGLSGVLYFDIGEVQINASREELKYSDSTKQAIVDKVNALIDEFVQHVLSKIDREGKTPWQRRIGAEVLRQLHLPVLNKALMEDVVRLPDGKNAPKSFHLSGRDSTKHTDAIQVNEHTRLLIHDNPQAISGYDLNRFDRVVRRKKTTPVAEVQKELEKYIRLLGIEGIPVKLLSELDWSKDRVYTSSSSGGFNRKHTKSLFHLRDNPRFKHPWSQDWEIGEHEPSDEDVFVIVERFQAYSGFDRHARTDKAVCAFFKKEFPKVLGYKSTERKPVEAKDCQGIEYQTWRKKLYESLKTPENLALVDLYRWSDASGHFYYHYTEAKRRYNKLPGLLGEDHPLVVWLHQRAEADKRWKRMGGNKQKAIKALSAFVKTAEPERLLKGLKAAYPLLLSRRNGWESLWEEDQSLWVDYVQLMDRVNAVPQTLTNEQDHDRQDASVHPDQRVDQRRPQGEDACDPPERGELCAAP